jgi:hypothetical protein
VNADVVASASGRPPASDFYASAHLKRGVLWFERLHGGHSDGGHMKRLTTLKEDVPVPLTISRQKPRYQLRSQWCEPLATAALPLPWRERGVG